MSRLVLSGAFQEYMYLKAKSMNTEYSDERLKKIMYRHACEFLPIDGSKVHRNILSDTIVGIRLKEWPN